MSAESLTELPTPIEQCLPVEKSWYGNLAFQALIEGNSLVIKSIQSYGLLLPRDVINVCNSSEQILRGETEIYVGEGGAWARKLAYGNAKFGWGLTIVKDGTLVGRPDEFKPEMVDASVDELRRLNKGSSQLASAAVLTGSTDAMPDDASYHLQMAYEARDFWADWPKDQLIPLRRDRTLRRQTLSALGYMMTGEIDFIPIQVEDYPFARVFGVMTAADAVARGWGNLEGHESSRLITTDEAIEMVEQGVSVPFADHRLLQPLRFKYGADARFDHVEAISKSWPLIQFNRAVALCHEYALAA